MVVVLDPEITVALTQLSQLATRNTVGAIQTRVATAKATKQHDTIVNELTEIINQLTEDRNELFGIANVLEEQLVAQRITEAEISYITDRLIPALEDLIGLAEDVDDDAVDAIRKLVTVETLTVLQLVGFNFKAAIGAPLTSVVEGLILQLAPSPSGRAKPKQQQNKR